jgi:uncharacterized protein (TIGR00369 family)
MTAPVRAYVDFASAYSYIAIQRLDPLVAAHGLTVDWQVVSLPHVLKAAGGVSPLAQPQKAEHNAADWQRKCARHNLPATMPEVRPVEAGLARLVFHRVRRSDPDRAAAFLRAVSARAFGQGLPIATGADLEAALSEVGLSDYDADIAAAAQDAGAKADLMAAFDAACADRMFGAPFVVIGDARFWGAEQLEAIDRHLSRVFGLPPGFAEIPVLVGLPNGFGPVFRKVEDGLVTLGLRVTTRHANPAGLAHGGLLASLADMAAGAQFAQATGSRPGVPTVSLSLDYLQPVAIGDWLDVSARVLEAGGRIAFVEGAAYAGGVQVLRFSGTLAPPRSPFSSNETA